MTQEEKLRYCYEMGKDAALNGPNTTNCDFRLFCSPMHTKQWERGKAQGERLKLIRMKVGQP